MKAILKTTKRRALCATTVLHRSSPCLVSTARILHRSQGNSSTSSSPPPSSSPSSPSSPPSPSPSGTQPKKSPIYTRTGDKGTSALFDGTRKNKDDETFHAIGTVDELNATFGVAIQFCGSHTELVAQLTNIQSRLLDIGGAIATPLSSVNTKKLAYVQFHEVHLQNLEKWIDHMDSTLPRLRNFILPGGGLGASHLHLCRTVCRRAERLVVPLVRSEQCDALVGRYLNRLSDYLFVAARLVAHQEQQQETIYTKE